MANTLHGPFSPINVVNGVTPANATWGNLVQTQAGIALNGLNGDFWSSFILSGCTPTKDGTVANQLDIASGIAYLRMTDNSVARCDVAATTFTTSTPSTTYYLDLNPDGSWSWGTTHSGVANHQLIAQCTTDGSGNISAVTDNRGPGGHPGVPYVVGRSGKQVYGSTSQQFPLIIPAAPAEGLYRANLFFSTKNPTGGSKFICYCAFQDSFTGSSTIVYFEQQSGGTGNAGQFLTGSQTNGVGSNQAVVCTPMYFESDAGQQITISTRDPSGTPNYAVWCSVERIDS